MRALVLISLLAAPSFAARPVPRIDFEEFKLPNGLRVILSPDSSVPVVSFSMIIPVGARQEVPGRSGFAHLFEHLMFAGSANVAKGRFDKILESCGAENNAETHLDFTLYYETLPANALRVAMWLDADRLSMLDVSTKSLRNQVDVVKEEKRLNVYNEPYERLLWVEISSKIYSNWANAHDTYGGFEDLDAASLADVRGFFDEHYAPINTTVAIVGDFEAAVARREVKRYFGWIPNRGTPPATDDFEPPQEGPRGFRAVDKHAKLSGAAILWRDMPQRRTRDYYALALLGRLLFKGKSARLYQLLVKREQAASAIDEPYEGGLGFPLMDFEEFRAPGLFGGFILRKDGVSAGRIRQLVAGEISHIAREGVTPEELNRVKTKFRSDWIVARQTTLGRATALLRAAALDGDPAAVNGELDHFFGVTREDVRLAAGKYLTRGKENVFDLEPLEKGEAAQ